MTRDTSDPPDDAVVADPEGLVTRAFGAQNRQRMLQAYFERAGAVSPSNAWMHVYRLLLWVDPTTGLAHCYESDKSQPGRTWYERSLAFHSWLSDVLETTPAALGNQIDWMFRRATGELTTAIAGSLERRNGRAEAQRLPYAGRGMPKPGQDPDLERMIRDEMGPYFAQQPPPELMERFIQRLRLYLSRENKRKNLVGEGFEDVLAFLIRQLPGGERYRLPKRSPLQELPGFSPPRAKEKEKKVDLFVLGGETRALVSAKWSVRADREEQFSSDFRAYAKREVLNERFDFVLVTNEFDAARLVAACELRGENELLFSKIVHINPQALSVVYPPVSPLPAPKASSKGSPKEPREVAAQRLPEHIGNGRLMSLEAWLASLVR